MNRRETTAFCLCSYIIVDIICLNNMMQKRSSDNLSRMPMFVLYYGFCTLNCQIFLVWSWTRSYSQTVCDVMLEGPWTPCSLLRKIKDPILLYLTKQVLWCETNMNSIKESVKQTNVHAPQIWHTGNWMNDSILVLFYPTKMMQCL